MYVEVQTDRHEFCFNDNRTLILRFLTKDKVLKYAILILFLYFLSARQFHKPKVPIDAQINVKQANNKL